MPEKNPLEPILDQIVTLLQRTEQELKNPSNKPITKDLLKQVEALEQRVLFFVELHNRSLDSADFDYSTLAKALRHTPKDASVKDQQVMDRIKKVKGELEQAKRLFEIAAKKVTVKKEDVKKKSITKRKKKFRGVGEGDKWKKL